jgi:hypothetical protein
MSPKSTRAGGRQRRSEWRIFLPLMSLMGLLGSVPMALAEPAGAQPGVVAVLPPLCAWESVPLAPFLASLRVELAGRGLACCTLGNATDWPSSNATVHIEIETVPCSVDPDRVHVKVSEVAAGRRQEREVTLADVTWAARPRALALAVAELVRSLEHAPPVATAEPASPTTVVAPPLRPPAGSRARGRSATLAIAIEVDARVFPTRDTVVWGGRARFSAGWRLFLLAFDAGGGYARARFAQGDVLMRTAGAGLDLGPRLSTRAADIALGLRAELGWAWVQGETHRTDVSAGAGSDLTATAGLRLSVEAPARSRVRPHVTLEGGSVLAGVKAEVNGQPVAGITGYYLRAALGVTLLF